MSSGLMTESSACKDAGPTAGLRERSPAHLLWMKVLVLVAIPAAACVSSFFIVDATYFRNHADPLWVQASEQIYRATNIRCDVVIFGDSTAITGLDPKIVSEVTHLRTCNIAQTKASLVVSGTTALDMFLRNNPRPRFLVLEFAGTNFYKPNSWSDTTAYMEGVVSLLRYYPHRLLIQAMAGHPDIVFGMMHYAYVTGPLNWWRNRRSVGTTYERDTPLNVHLIRPVQAYTDCKEVVDTDPIFHKPDTQFIRQLRMRYSTSADHVVLDAAPTSTCDVRFGYLRKNLVGLDNTLEYYPVQLFNEGYDHFTSQGATRWSHEVADQIGSMNASTLIADRASEASLNDKAR